MSTRDHQHTRQREQPTTGAGERPVTRFAGDMPDVCTGHAVNDDPAAPLALARDPMVMPPYQLHANRLADGGMAAVEVASRSLETLDRLELRWHRRGWATHVSPHDFVSEPGNPHLLVLIKPVDAERFSRLPDPEVIRHTIPLNVTRL